MRASPGWQVKQDEWAHCRTSEPMTSGTNKVLGEAPPGSMEDPRAYSTLSSTCQLTTPTM